MSTDSSSTPQRIRDRLAGHHILVTGATGFLAKAFIEKLLRSVDTIGGIHLLVRPRPGGMSPQDRVRRDVVGSRAFDRLRACLGTQFGRLCDEKLRVVAGDLTREQLGIDSETYTELTGRITLVVNCAATVTFDERLDLAVELNSLGPSRLLGFARDCGNAPFLHVSTAYVCGRRTGVVVEDFATPPAARGLLPSRPGTSGVDLDALLQSLREETAALREKFGADTEAGRKALIKAGMSRSRAHGWHDTYTFTKWIGEQLLVRDHGDVPCAVFRPAIIESSYEEPTPGWIDGLRMADPIIVAYGRGKLTEFPALPEIPLDLIPVDYVANAMITALPLDDAARGQVAVYHGASSNRHPLPLHSLVHSLHRAFIKRPMNSDDGRPIHPGPLRLVDSRKFLKRWQRRRRRVEWLRRLLERYSAARRQARRLSSASRQIDQLIYFAEIYSPYTHLDCRFDESALRARVSRLHADDAADFPCDVQSIDWDDYLVNRHVPGVRSFVLGTGWEPSARIRAVEGLGEVDATPAREALRGENIFDVFQRSAQRWPEKHALQIRRAGRWIRYTYDEVLRATGTIMRRFQEHDLLPGDRVVIYGESSPEWGLTYLAAMRAGLTAVPIDPQLPVADAWAAARYVRARLICAGTNLANHPANTREEHQVDVETMSFPFIPPPAASRDPLPDPIPVVHHAVASILFTSGTTVAPKAVALTHQNFIANAQALVEVHPVYAADEFLSVLPMYHAFEFTGGFLVPLAAGATITYVEQLKGPEIRAAMQATGTSVMLVVPRLIRMFHDALMKELASAGAVKRGLFRGLSVVSRLTAHRFARRLFGPIHRGFGGRLRLFVSGGSRLEPDLFRAFKRLGFTVCEGYGLTETSPVVTVNPPGGERAGSVGPVLPNVEIEIRRENLEGIGEVWVRGPSVMSGYLENPEATHEVIADGWFRTGDLGRLDADGYLYLTGRSKDLIITAAGKNVYPDEVEARYRDLPYVTELCAFGMPSADGMGDAVHAVVVLQPDSTRELDPSSMQREVRLAVEAISDSLPPHQRIAVLHFWERELPKTSTLKAKRNVIRQMVTVEEESEVSSGTARSRADLLADGGGDGVKANPEAFAAVCRILAGQSKRAEQSLRPQMHLLLDLGIDSIGKMEVLGAVEARFGMRIDDEQAARVARIADLLNLIGQRRPAAETAAARHAWQRRMGPATAGRLAQNGQLPAPLLPVRWLMRGGVAAFMNTYVRVHVHGRENIPANGGFILAPNHSSHLDSPGVLTAVGGKRRVWIAGAEDYFFSNGLKRFVFGRVFDTIAFDRKADGLRGLRRCGDALSRGDGLLLFPEGTRSLTGELQPFRIGVAVLAVERQVPIVPVYIDRTYDLLRKGQRFVRPGAVRVTFGRPVVPPPIDRIDDHYAVFRSLTAQVEQSVTALKKETSA